MISTRVAYSASTGWVDDPAVLEPPLRGELACEVAIIGGGYLGMVAALRLAERGADVALLESGYCGFGASSRNAGQITNSVAGDPALLEMLYPRRLHRLVRFADNAAGFTDRLIRRHQIDCDYETTGNVMAAVSPSQLQRIRRNVRILQRAGAHAEFVDGRDFGLPRAFPGGVFESGGGLLNPGKFALALRDVVRESDARVFERTPVHSVEVDAAGVEVMVPGGRVRAGRVLLATNAYSRGLPFAPKRMVTPLWTSLVETEPIDPERLTDLGWTSRAGIATAHTILENYRLTQRGTIVFGTRQLQSARGAAWSARQPSPSVVADMVRAFHERFPSLLDVAPRQAWGGWIAMTTSLLPIAGEATDNVFYAVGCNGHGLAQAPYLGSLLADRILGDDPPDDLGAIWRRRPRFAPAPAFSAPMLRALWVLDRVSDRVGQKGKQQ